MSITHLMLGYGVEFQAIKGRFRESLIEPVGIGSTSHNPVAAILSDHHAAILSDHHAAITLGRMHWQVLNPEWQNAVEISKVDSNRTPCNIATTRSRRKLAGLET